MPKVSPRQAGAAALEAELAAILKLPPEERENRRGKGTPRAGPRLDWDAVRGYFENEVGGKWAKNWKEEEERK